ncbi:MAG: D-alanyl-D-alanine carboxypeptidase [Oscillospiraceae bacterium]|nr:D-alanyl-D-alanine carboxypeptidase [Oscillospiraceae bacterium]MDE7171198.1 D-alanyl-D-alanine carboxypeptidase [Oscillospiraceae bacterium]
MKRITALALTLLCLLSVPAYAAPAGVTAPSAVLMEKTTGTVLSEQDSKTQYEPASVTKIMTLLLVMEAIDGGSLGWDDMVTASAYACSMGGSQIWLKENEQLTVRDMVKAVTVVSANDCAVALAEHVAGSETAFVERMNQRAAELGMENTTFKNCTGLPAEGHLTCAYDIALMSRELILNHPSIREFTTIWMDTLRDGTFQLSNTNKLIFYYEGATGLKTGFTDTALYCLSATAERDGMELIAVVMHAPTSNDRFESCKTLLNYGFANYAITPVYPDQAIPPVAVSLGTQDTVQPVTARECSILLEKSKTGAVTTQLELCENVEAPVEAGQKLGELKVLVDGEQVDVIDLVAAQEVPRLSLGGIFKRFLNSLFLQGD